MFTLLLLLLLTVYSKGVLHIACRLQLRVSLPLPYLAARNLRDVLLCVSEVKATVGAL
jgi:hypothetical protein